MTTAYTSLYNWVMPDVPSVVPDMATNAIRDAVIEFCERTLLYRQELQQILVLAPTATTLAAATAASATSITVADITNFNSGDTLTVALDDTTSWRGHVSGTPSGVTIALDGALPSAASSGNAVTKLVYLYSITVPTGTAFVKGLQAWLNDNPLDPISQDDLDNEFNNTSFGWVGVNWRTDVNLPTRFYFPDDSTVGLLLAPNAQGVLRINAALKPTRASTTFPDWIYERYVETIAHGAKWKLMAVPKKPYSDPVIANYHQAEFMAGCAEARERTARAATRAPLRTHTVFGLR